MGSEMCIRDRDGELRICVHVPFFIQRNAIYLTPGHLQRIIFFFPKKLSAKQWKALEKVIEKMKKVIQLVEESDLEASH